jgi:transcription elongation factor GreA-like protein
MSPKSPSKVIYSLNTDDVQHVADEVLDRTLTKSELAKVQESVGNYIDWYQAIENAIHAHGMK